MKYTILARDSRMNGSILDVFVDNTEGFNEFLRANAGEILPGSKVDIADVKTVFRLRHDGTWEEYSNYAASAEEAEALQEAAVASVMDDLIPDDEIEESEESA